MKSCNDKQTFYAAREQYDGLLVTLEATCLACERAK